MASVVTQRNSSAVRPANASVGRKDQDFLAAEFGRVPAHTGVLRPAKQIAGGPVQQHFGGDGHGALRAWSLGSNIENGSV